jgi:hypothetical protein
MRAIAIGCVAGSFALAEEAGLGFLGCENVRQERAAFMFSIAKGLAVGLAACAIGVLFSRYQVDFLGKPGCNFRLFHHIRAWKLLKVL